MNEDAFAEDIKPNLTNQGIWQRLPEESPGAYAAFTTYLELGPDSTLPQVAETLGRSSQSIRHLSWRHNWLERAAAYRQHVANISLVAAQHERTKQAELSQMREVILRQQMWEASQSLIMACRHSLNHFLNDPEPKIAPYALAGFLNLCFRLGQRASEPGRFTSDGPAPASPDFDAAVEKVYGENMTLEHLVELMKTLPSSAQPASPTSTNGTPTPTSSPST